MIAKHNKDKLIFMFRCFSIFFIFRGIQHNVFNYASIFSYKKNSEAAKQQSSEAAKQQSSKAAKQQSSEAAKHKNNIKIQKKND